MTTAAPSHWDAHPVSAFALRSAIVLMPVLAAAGVGVLIGELLGAPDDLGGWILWAVIVGIAGLATGVVVERAARRFAPLALLVRLSLIFPDRAPSRLRMALRASSTTRLQAWLEADEHSESDSAQQHADTILTLALALNAHDRRTRGHSERVRALTELVADGLGLDDETKDRLRWAALLHDIGKLAVPAEILNKPGAPDTHELEVLRRHPEEGVRLAAPLAEFLGESSRAIGEHHERFDGAGYPSGLAGNEIALAGRIVAVTDAFDTMTSVRSYKRAMSIRAAREEVACCAGSHFDPAAARAFLDVSFPRLWLVVGPASLLAQIPLVGLALRGALGATELPALAAAGTGALGSAAALVVGAVLITGPTNAPPDPPSPPDSTTNTTGAPEPEGAPDANDPVATTPGEVPPPTVPPGSSLPDAPLAALPELPSLGPLVPGVVDATQNLVERVEDLLPVTVPEVIPELPQLP